MKYDSQITNLKNVLPTAGNILIAIAPGGDIDKLAAGLALSLTLESNGKKSTVVCDENILVSQAHLFGIDKIEKSLTSKDGGNLTLTLEGVAASDGTVPSLEKLDWYAEGNNLNLVFHVLPGQSFQPQRIIPSYQGSGFNLIFVIGAGSLNVLGNIYSQNQDIFSGGAHIVNIDTQTSNSFFGQTNIADTNASSISEIAVNLISDLGYSLDPDVATNLITGIFSATSNLTNTKASADTYLAVAQALKAGGRKPNVQQVAQSQSQPQQTINQAQPSYDWNALSAAIGQKVTPTQEKPTQQQPAAQTEPAPTEEAIQPSPEEQPAGEGVISETVEPEWLTPKIFKGSSIG